MSFDLGSETLILHQRVPVLDGSGNPVRNAYARAEITEVDVPVEGCDFYVTESQETESSVTTTRLVGRGMLPPGTAVDYTSALTWQGIKFEVHGPPRPVANIRDTTIDHIAITGRSYLGNQIPGTREDG